jgi:hypothetical protein
MAVIDLPCNLELEVIFTLRLEHRLRVYEKRVLRRKFGPKEKDVAGGCRRLHNEKLLNLYHSKNIIS